MGVEGLIAVGVGVEGKRKPPVSRGCDEPSRTQYELLMAHWADLSVGYGASRVSTFATKKY
jgi:hypothetical protein